MIRGNDRMYTIYRPGDSIPSRLPEGWFDRVATNPHSEPLLLGLAAAHERATGHHLRRAPLVGAK